MNTHPIPLLYTLPTSFVITYQSPKCPWTNISQLIFEYYIGKLFSYEKIARKCYGIFITQQRIASSTLTSHYMLQPRCSTSEHDIMSVQFGMCALGKMLLWTFMMSQSLLYVRWIILICICNRWFDNNHNITSILISMIFILMVVTVMCQCRYLQCITLQCCTHSNGVCPRIKTYRNLIHNEEHS